MSKLFKLKKWLTLSEAANHLSLVLEEDIAESDVLQFALDGDLTLSVQFVNPAYGGMCVQVDPNEVVWNEFPSLPVVDPFIYTPRDGRVWQTGDISFQVADHVRKLKGVWDLPMTGGERIDVQSEYQKLMGGPAVTELSLHGVFVKSPSGVLYEIQTSIEPLVEIVPVPTFYSLKEFHAAVTLPKDRVFVMRTNAILDFIKYVNEESSIVEEVIDSSEIVIQLSTEESEFDPFDFPEELDTARNAFLAVTNGYGSTGKTFKNRMIDYVKETYPNLSESAVSRITTVANPDKATGRKKFDKK